MPVASKILIWQLTGNQMVLRGLKYKEIPRGISSQEFSYQRLSKGTWKIRIERRPTEAIYPELNSSLVTKMGLKFRPPTLAPSLFVYAKMRQPPEITSEPPMPSQLQIYSFINL